ncbi:beta,beta-carotene 15,15'-dioxygenase [Trichonephila clavata]|uniref:Beta,beta-carotene 15,15'-dioxygenase n=1 Tax=Trichonephila clavata TaxID=2740835 RepID=A0A8X6KDG0_TRICU|nr:beta,beta-carotene 15,15'-dioxygenase [Trichonephila clavata]
MPGKRAKRHFSQLSEFERGLSIGMKTAGWSTHRVAGQVDRSECAVRNCWEQWTQEGNIPDWLKGQLFMVAPGKWDFDDGFSVNHWLDGSAFMYKFNIEKDRVDVMSRFLDTVAYKKVCETKRPVYVEFGTKAYPDQGKNAISRKTHRSIKTTLLQMMSNLFIIGADDDVEADVKKTAWFNRGEC